MFYTLKNGKRLRVSINAKRGTVKVNDPMSYMRLRVNNRKVDFKHVALGLPVADLRHLLDLVKFTEQTFNLR